MSRPHTTTDPVGIVIHPGHSRAAQALRLVHALAPHATILTTSRAEPGGPQVHALVRRGARRIVVIGGDGTVRAVAHALAQHAGAAVLGIMPTGTANITARNLAISPARLSYAAVRALQGPPRALDLGQVSADHAPPLGFVIMAGVGHDARTVTLTQERAKQRYGPGAYALAALRTWRHEPWRGDLYVDGAEVSRAAVSRAAVSRAGGAPADGYQWTVLAGNLPLIPGRIPVFPGARPDDGLLHVLRVPSSGLTAWARTAAFGLASAAVRPQLLTPPSSLEYRTARRIEVVCQQPQPIQLDGDVLPPARRVLISIQPGALRVAGPLRARSDTPPATS